MNYKDTATPPTQAALVLMQRIQDAYSAQMADMEILDKMYDEFYVGNLSQAVQKRRIVQIKVLADKIKERSRSLANMDADLYLHYMGMIHEMAIKEFAA